MVYNKGFLSFFRELEANNEREWFKANKSRYEDEVVTPTGLLITAMGPLLSDISPHLRADPRRQGGSMFRIYRDTRFSKDKAPYKTWLAVQFRHLRGKDVHAPGYYFSANHEQFVIGCGIWHPDRPALEKIRKAITVNGERWNDIKDNASFNDRFEWRGESLKRPPRGYDKEHPHLEDIKRKDFVGMSTLPAETALDPDLPQVLMAHYRAAVPLMRFLCEALALEF